MAQLKIQLEVTRHTCLCIKTKPFFTGKKKKNPLTNLSNSCLAIKFLLSNSQCFCHVYFLMFSEESDKKDKKREFLQKSGRQPKFISPLLGLLDAQY